MNLFNDEFLLTVEQETASRNTSRTGGRNCSTRESRIRSTARQLVERAQKAQSHTR